MAKDQFTSPMTSHYDSSDKPVRIERQTCTFEVLKGIFYTRKQFPLMLAFAITIHKSQGLSLRTAIVDAGTACFGTGMIYVALSRLTSLEGLHLIDFNKQKLCANKACICKYNRLRELYTPQLERLPIEGNRKRTSDETSVSEDKRQRTRQPSADSANTDGRSRREHRTKMKKNAADESRASAAENVAAPSGPVASTPVKPSFSVQSIGAEIQQSVCSNFNLFHHHETPSHTCAARRAVARRLQKHLQHEFQNVPVEVEVISIGGHDGNCLFRALSQAITRNVDQHALIRQYVVNHMTDPHIEEPLARQFLQPGQAYAEELVRMAHSGAWGTDREIAAAAHLFNCSILCFSRYGDGNKYCLQQFAPDFLDFRVCTTECHHDSIYLVNPWGDHYELAIVTTADPPNHSQHHNGEE